jgi:hypothetical protein
VASAAEVEAFVSRYPGASIEENPDGSAVAVIPKASLPSGWSSAQTAIRFVIPPAYPAAQPDCFFADADLRLASGAMPQNAGHQGLNGVQYLWFSWHLSSWRPNQDTLLTYAHFIEQRLTNAN